MKLHDKNVLEILIRLRFHGSLAMSKLITLYTLNVFITCQLYLSKIVYKKKFDSGFLGMFKGISVRREAVCCHKACSWEWLGRYLLWPAEADVISRSVGPLAAREDPSNSIFASVSVHLFPMGHP